MKCVSGYFRNLDGFCEFGLKSSMTCLVIGTCVVTPTADMLQILGLLSTLPFCPVTGQCSLGAWQFISQNNFCNLQFFPRSLMCQLDLYF